MHTSTLLASVVALTSSLVSAQYNITSKPFALVLASKNTTLDGVALYSCHEGAAIEGLCIGSKLDASAYKYNFNTSVYDQPGQTKNGYLTWVLKGGNFEISEPLQISNTLISNVAVPLFTPSESGTLLGWDKNDKLYVPGYIDDTVSPINTNAPKNYYRWWVCNTYSGYAYQTLAWVVGNKPPQNPSCQRVEVVRVFEKAGGGY